MPPECTFTQCVSGVLILSSPPSARLWSFICWFLLILNTTCSPCVWAFLSIRVRRGALFLLPHHRAVRPRSKWWFDADMIDCMDHGELTWTVLQCVRCSVLGLKNMYFSIFGNYRGTNNQENVRARRRANSVRRGTPASGRVCPEVHFSVVQMLSTAYFSTSTMKRSQSRLHSRHWFCFPVAVIFFSATHLNNSVMVKMIYIWIKCTGDPES